jgi:segregation and condensation protein A
MEHQPLAKVMGEFVKSCPDDLFIPPDALQILLEKFEGPLDLLLYLIRKQNLDILDIPISDITAQYLEYIDLMGHARLHLAAEYLVMASALLEIKSRLLLPPLPSMNQEDCLEEDPRALLVRRLLEYEKLKQASHLLDDLPRAGRDFLWAYLSMDVIPKVLPSVSIEDLHTSILSVFKKLNYGKNHQIIKSQWTIHEQILLITKMLHQRKIISFADIYTQHHGDISYLVVSFIAILELSKQGIIKLDQINYELPIYLIKE